MYPSTLPIVGDVGHVTLTFFPGTGAQLPMGTSHVSVLAMDEGGNYVRLTVTVVVRDTTPPVITAPNMTVEGNTTAADRLGVRGDRHRRGRVGHADLLDPAGLVLPGREDHGDRDGDRRRGELVDKTFTVTVRDTTPPVFTFVSPNLTVDATGKNGAVVQYGAATASDAVGPVTITYSKASGSTFALGTTTVTVTAKDGAGNKTTATFTVTVVDRTPPTIPR